MGNWNPTQHRQAALDILNRYSDHFANSPEELGESNIVQNKYRQSLTLRLTNLRTRVLGRRVRTFRNRFRMLQAEVIETLPSPRVHGCSRWFSFERGMEVGVFALITEG